MSNSAEHTQGSDHAPWVANLKHRKDPNRVSDLLTPHAGTIQRASDVPPDTVVAHVAREKPKGDAYAHDAQHARLNEPSYYDVPMLQPPVWEKSIAVYFWLGGISAGSFIVSRLASRFGGARYRDASRLASYVSLLALAPCPPLLIADLGDPMRFHHMLRIWKPTSPMNFGSWVLTGYGAPCAIEAVRQFLAARGDAVPPEERSRLTKLAENGKLIAVTDAAGLPLALLLATYTGILLSTTSNPLWCKNRWLAPLFVASAVSTSVEAVSLAVDVMTRGERSEAPQAALRRIDTVAHAAEGVALAGFLKEAGEKAAPLTTGAQKTSHHVAMGAIVAAEVLKLVPVPASMRKQKRIVTNALGLVGGLAVRWSMCRGGATSGNDPHAARVNSRARAEPSEANPYTRTPTTPNARSAAGAAPRAATLEREPSGDQRSPDATVLYSGPCFGGGVITRAWT